MLKLVVKVSKNNFDQKDRKYIEEILFKAENSFLDLMEKDIEVYKKNHNNKFENKEDLKQLIEIPLEIYMTATEIINLKNKFNDKVKNSVKADYKIAFENLKTAKKGAKTIIENNYSFFDENSKFLKDIKNRVQNLN